MCCNNVSVFVTMFLYIIFNHLLVCNFQVINVLVAFGEIACNK